MGGSGEESASSSGATEGGMETFLATYLARIIHVERGGDALCIRETLV